MIEIFPATLKIIESAFYDEIESMKLRGFENWTSNLYYRLDLVAILQLSQQLNEVNAWPCCRMRVGSRFSIIRSELWNLIGYFLIGSSLTFL